MKRAIANLIIFSILIVLTACSGNSQETTPPAVTPTSIPGTNIPVGPTPTAIPNRPLYNPGELVEYTAQTGDTIAALAERFNTTSAEIMAANPFIPDSATTMPPGMPMQIPIYHRNFWGTAFKIIRDSLYVKCPAAVNFDTQPMRTAPDQRSSTWLPRITRSALAFFWH
jgi:LysM repeat protein